MPKSYEEVQLELEIRRTIAINNYSWSSRVFRRCNRDVDTDLRIILAGVSQAEVHLFSLSKAYLCGMIFPSKVDARSYRAPLHSAQQRNR